MTATFKRIIAIGIALIVVAGVAVAFVMTGGCSATSTDPLAGARADAINTIIDTMGIKDRIESELYSHSAEISETYDIPQSIVDNGIESLDIQDWQATVLPDEAVETGTFDVDTGDVEARITTYDDPSIVTIEAYGQTVTLEIPETAQYYLPLLEYL